MKKEDSRDSLIDIPLEDDRDESQLTGRKAAEYNKQHVIRHKKRVRTKILCALGILLALLAILAVIAVILVNVETPRPCKPASSCTGQQHRCSTGDAGSGK